MFNESDVSMEEKSVNEVSVPEEENTVETDELVALDSLTDEESVSELAALDGEETEEDGVEDGETKAVSSERVVVVGVRFKPNGKAYFFDPNGLSLKAGDNVVVETMRGLEYGNISFAPRDVSSENLVLPLRPVLRVATDEDNARSAKNLETETRAIAAFQAGVKKHDLSMRLLDVECAFDQSKIIFNFAAASRIDFRELVRDLASEFHTRIELKQVASRDVTKMIGGLGICGRPFCCSSFLSNAIHTTIKMAKIQYTSSLNCDKISGACGRLMCCLKYEYSTYEQEMKLTPKRDAEVMSPLGEGRVIDSNPLTGLVKVKLVKPDGTDADETPVVFLRDDLVLKSEYKGEVLTRTPLPEKRRTEVSSLATFEVRSPFSDTLGGETESPLAAAERLSKAKNEDRKKRDGGKPKNNAPKDNKDNKDNGRKNTPKPEQGGAEKTAGEEKFENYEKYEKFDRPKGGKFDRNGKRGKNHSGRPQNQQGEGVPASGGEGSGNTQAPKSEKKPFKPNAGNNSNAPAEGVKQNHAQGEGKEGGHGGKKFHKPYYRNNKNKGHGGHGGNGGNAGGGN